MRLVFTPHGWQDYTWWQSADRATLKRVNRLIESLQQARSGQREEHDLAR